MSIKSEKKEIIQDWTQSIKNGTFWGDGNKHHISSLSATDTNFRTVQNPKLYAEPNGFLQSGNYPIKEYKDKDFPTPYYTVPIQHGTGLTDAGSGVPRNTVFTTSFTADVFVVIYDNKKIPHGHAQTTEEIQERIKTGKLTFVRDVPDEDVPDEDLPIDEPKSDADSLPTEVE